MATKTLGKARWSQLAMKRQARWEGRFVDMYDILQDMKEETGCHDNMISLEQFSNQIANLEAAKEVRSKEKTAAYLNKLI
jgi:hypothetical protein